MLETTVCEYCDIVVKTSLITVNITRDRQAMCLCMDCVNNFGIRDGEDELGRCNCGGVSGEHLLGAHGETETCKLSEFADESPTEEEARIAAQL